jgi:hypothetical protein
MDIHKPKPWRGRPEFLKEIGTIVIGVLIALGAEQTVEWLHVQRQIADARDALRDEISHDATSVAYSMEEDRCVLSWFARLGAWAKGGARPDGSGLRRSMAIYPTAVWDIAKAGAVPHMALKEQLAYAGIYSGFQNYNAIVERERSDAQKIISYQDQERLTPAQASGLLEAIAATRPVMTGKIRIGPVLIEEARKLGAGPKPLPAAARQELEAFCATAGAPPPRWPPGA